MGTPFEVGKSYRNRAGEYVVVAIDGDKMTIRYTNGAILETTVPLQARIWDNIQIENQQAREDERQRLAQEARLSARQNSARARQAKSAPKFDGFQESDFEAAERGIAWSTRKELGKVLVYELGRRTGRSLASWVVPRHAALHLARTDAYDPSARDSAAALYVAVDPLGADYGLCVTKPEGEAQAGGPWARLVDALHEDEPVRQGLQAAMEAHGLGIRVEMHPAEVAPAAGRQAVQVEWIKAQGDQLLRYDEKDGPEMGQALGWGHLAAHLRVLGADRPCSLYAGKQVSPGEALQAGSGVSAQIVAVLEALMPLYETSAGA